MWTTNKRKAFVPSSVRTWNNLNLTRWNFETNQQNIKVKGFIKCEILHTSLRHQYSSINAALNKKDTCIEWY